MANKSIIIILIFFTLFSCSKTKLSQTNISVQDGVDNNESLNEILQIESSQNVNTNLSFIERLPIINNDNVNVRDFPDIYIGTVRYILNNNQKVSIKYRTNDEEKINESYNYWYYISPQDGENANHHGWIYGEFITFMENFDEDYWNNYQYGIAFPYKINVIDRKIIYRNIIANRIVLNLFGEREENGPYNLNILSGYDIIHQQSHGLWYMIESGFNVAITFQMEYGKVIGFVNTTTNEWYLFMLIIEDKIEGLEIFPGMSVSEIEYVLGKDFKYSNGKIEYLFQEGFHSFFWTFEIIDEKVKSFSIQRFYT
jgi:hypothetical protein